MTTSDHPFKYRVWDFYEDAAEHAKDCAVANKRSYKLVLAGRGWQIPGLRTEENEAGFDPYRYSPILYALKLQAKESGVPYVPHPALTEPDKWTLEAIARPATYELPELATGLSPPDGWTSADGWAEYGGLSQSDNHE